MTLLAAPVGCGGLAQVSASDAGPDSCVMQGVLTTGGSVAQPLLTTALGGHDFYWFTSMPGTESIQGVDKCGGSTFQVTTGIAATDSSLPSGSLLSLAADAHDVYFTNISLEWARVEAVPRWGGSPVVIASEGVVVPLGLLAVDATDVYWASLPGEIRARSKRGGPMRVVAVTDSVVTFAVNETDVVWLGLPPSKEGFFVSSVPKAGGAGRTLVSGARFGAASPYLLAVDEANAYYVAASGHRQGLYSAALEGGTPTVLVEGDAAASITSIAVDEASVYFCAFEGAIRKVSKRGGPVTTLVPSIGTASQVGLQVDATSIYWLSVDGNVWKAPK